MQEFTGKQYLAIDIASNYGLDKEPWAVRLAWFDTNKAALDTLVATAKEPALFYAGVQAWKAVERGEPIGYMISLDATSSGLQLLAALTGDRKAAKLCNVISTGNREDAYTGIYQWMLNEIQDSSKISREDVKQAVMTSLYSSKAEPKRVFGEGSLLDVFYDTMKEAAPGAWELNEAMLGLWNPNGLSHDWTMPDNFHVHIKVMNQVKETVNFLNEPFDIYYNINAPMDEGRSLGANTIHSIDGMIVREMSRRCDYNPVDIVRIWDAITGEGEPREDDESNHEMVVQLWAQYLRSGYLSARILAHLDHHTIGYTEVDVIKELIMSLPKKPFKVISIHDCFRCLPHYGNDLRKQYNLQLQLIAKSNLLSFIVSQLVGKTITVNKLDNGLWKDILSTDYALS